MPQTKAQRQASYRKNKEKIRTRQKAYYLKNKEKITARQRTYNEKNKEKQQEYFRNYRNAHSQHYREYDKLRRNLPHRVKLHNEAVKKYRQKHPERAAAYASDSKKRADNCQKCGRKKNLHFHHTDYFKSEGITLCVNCHEQQHHTTAKEKK